MVVLFSSGFETGNFTEWNLGQIDGNESVQNTIKHSGNYAMKCVNTAAGCLDDLGAGQADVFWRFYVYFNTLPPNGNVIQLGFIADAATANPVKAFVGTDGVGTHRWVLEDTHGVDYVFDTTINTGQWYSVEYRRQVGAAGAVQLWIDGTLIEDQVDNIATNSQIIALGSIFEGVASDSYWDDAQLSDVYNGPLVESPALGTFLTCLAK